MDLLDYRDKYGRKALTELASRAGIEPSYLAQLMGGFRRIRFERAQRLSALHPELDVVALQLMADRVRERKKRREKNARRTNGAKKSVTARKRAPVTS